MNLPWARLTATLASRAAVLCAPPCSNSPTFRLGSAIDGIKNNEVLFRTLKAMNRSRFYVFLLGLSQNAMNEARLGFVGRDDANIGGSILLSFISNISRD
jgi:hypothetical protein